MLLTATDAATTLSSLPLLGILLAVIGATLIAFGNQEQSVGVASASDPKDASSGLSLRQLRRLVTTPRWLLGSALIAVSMLFQLGALSIAPLSVVQPLGVIALVIAAVITARVTRTRPNRRSLLGIALAVVGVGAFVATAASVASAPPVTDERLLIVLAIVSAGLLAFIVFRLVAGRRTVPPLVVVIGAGVFSGFVVTLSKVVILRVRTELEAGISLDESNLITIGCLIGVAVAGLLSIYLAQSAHAVASSAVVVAGLTVVDPLVAVTIGMTVLGEASSAPPWAIAVFLASGAVAVAGVVLLAIGQSSTAAPASTASAPAADGVAPSA